MLSFPFSHLQMFFPALATRSCLSNMQIASDGVLGEGSASWTCAAWVNAALCSAHGQTDCAWKKQTRGWVYYPITIFLSWDVLSRPHVFYSLKCLMADCGSAFSGQAGPVNRWGRGGPSHPVDTPSLSLDSRGSVVSGEGGADMDKQHPGASPSFLHPDVDVSAPEIRPDTPKAGNSSVISLWGIFTIILLHASY